MEPFDDRTDLLRALFATTGPGASAGWAEFLALLRKVTQADRASLVLDARNRSRSWDDGGLIDLDPAARQSLRFDRVYSQENLATRDGGAAPLRVMKVRSTLAASLTLSLGRHAFGRDFRGTDGQMLHGLAPFLGQAMGLWLEREQQHREAADTAAMLAGLGGAWVVLDATTRVLRYSRALPGLRGQTGFAVEDGRPLRFPDLALAAEFQRAFARASAGDDPVVMALPQGEMILTQIEQDRLPLVLGRLRLVPEPGRMSPKAVARHFGISASEARLALLICDGHSLQAAAKQLGWTEASTRTCSKALFARLAVDGQPGVVRRILTSSVWYLDG